jgi:putative colanic acid biosynthesis UDP-glucose lipid carrier transferase
MSDPTLSRLLSSVGGVRTGNRTVVSAVRSLVDPALAIATLWVSCRAWNVHFGAPEVVLSLAVFALTYPGTIPFRRHRLGYLRDLVVGWAFVIGLLGAFGLASGLLGVFDQNSLVTWAIATPLVQALAHYLAPFIVPRVMALRPERKAVIVAANETGRAMARSILADPLSSTRVAAFFDDRAVDRLGPLEAPLVGTIDATAGYVKSHGVEQIFIALPMASQPRIRRLLEDLRDTTASIHFLPDVFVFDMIQARVDTFGGLPVVTVCESPFHGTTAVAKRVSDIVIATGALVLAAPLMLAIAVAIRLESRGPAIFRQRRYGMDGREIVVWKFRTMTVQEDGDRTYTQVTPDDARVTRVGRWLRRTSLDELPQFFNVLQGRMSVVGPRPHAVAVNEAYRTLIPGYMLRHKIRPGITGLAQIHGLRGGDDLDGMQQRVDLDLQYLRTWSLGLDMQIVLRTARLLLGDTRAY